MVDRSRSMIEPHTHKRVVALQAAAGLAYLALVNQHRVSLFSVADAVRRELPPLKGQGHIHEILKQLPAMEFSGVTDLVGSLGRFRPSRDRCGMVFLLSDLFGQAPEQSAQALAHAASWPAETHVIHILHPREIRPELDGELRLVDVETGERRRLWLTRRELDRYARAFADYLEDLKRTCVQRQINYMTWTTDESFEETFINMLSRGSALAGA